MADLDLPDFDRDNPADFPFAQGRIRDDEATRAFQATLLTPVFRATAAGMTDDPLPDQYFQWAIQAQLLGKKLATKNQKQVGSCVAFGTVWACLNAILGDMLRGDREEFRDLVEEIVYGLSRVQVNGGRCPFNGDGSVGAWAMKAVTKWGVIARGIYNGIDLSTYSESLCRTYGSKGIPKELEAVAAQHKFLTFSQVQSGEDVRKAIAQNYGVIICSGQGFTLRRDDEGFCEPRGTWGHCTGLDGYYKHPKRGWIYHRQNSWSDGAYSGPAGIGDPGLGGWWMDEKTLLSEMHEGDSWAVGTFDGFPKQKIQWIF